jgi:hypothetical protein
MLSSYFLVRTKEEKLEVGPETGQMININEASDRC